MSFLALALFLVFSSPVSWPLSSAQTIVTHLPWFDGPLPFHLETGYVEVDEEKQAHMFYYFIKSERNPAEDPLILWHTGGPMCSALSALFLEFGPLSVDVAAYNEGRSCLVNNPHAWTQTSNIIFVDAPIGTGFSYSNSPGLYKISDTMAYLQLSIFMQKWFMNHQEFMTNPLYVAGDSYAGKIVPLVAQELVNNYRLGSIVPLNLKGYLIGNAPGDRHYDSSHIPYAHGMGLLSDEIYESVKQNCKGNFSSEHEDCSKAIGSAFMLLKVNWAHILEPSCSIESPKHHTVGRGKLPMECRGSGYFLTGLWANEHAVRQALGIREGTVPHWIRCERHSPMYTIDIRSNLKVHIDLTTRGYRALVYSGDHDLMMPYVGTQAWIASLNFSIVSAWRPWFVNSQVSGYTKTYSNNLTFATVMGAGHAAAEYRPKECKAMFDRWISNAPL